MCYISMYVHVQALSRIDQFADLKKHLFKPGEHVKVELKKMVSIIM